MNIYLLYFNNIIKKILFISFCFFPLNALIYEDAENLGIDKWSIIASTHKEKIDNIFDEKKHSRVIRLKGDRTKSTFILKCKEASRLVDFSKSTFEWEMNYSEDFVILIDIETKDGMRQLIYTLGRDGSSFQYGLGELFKNQWKKYHRNLEKDLQIFEKNNKLLKIKNFVIKGSGFVDNIRLNTVKKRVKPLKKKIAIKKEEILKKSLSPNKKVDGNKIPVININGKNTVFLTVGEEYIEEGATAKNPDGSEISVKISHNIDILKEGEYAVIYIATNSLGNSSIDKRRVVVGKVSTQKKSVNKNKMVNNEFENNSFHERHLELKRIDNENRLERIYNEEKYVRPLRPGL